MVHLVKIIEIDHLDANGNIIWNQKNIKNTFHQEGEYFLLSVAFNSVSGVTVPTSYYLGLDNRVNIQLNDGLENLSEEPTQNGYTRQAVSSANGFTVSLQSDNYLAVSTIVAFQATGGSWGPIRNIFLATTSTNSGYLLSSVALSEQRTVNDGENLTMRLSLGLINT